MKSLLAMAAAVLILGACHYDFAAVKPTGLPLDPAIAGRWIQATEPEEGDGHQVLLVIPSRQGGAFIDLLVEENVHWFFRADPLAKDLPGLYQLEFLGASDGERPEDDPFTIASVTTTGKRLTWRLIEPDKVGEVKDGKALLARIRKAAKDDEDLFGKASPFAPAP